MADWEPPAEAKIVPKPWAPPASAGPSYVFDEDQPSGALGGLWDRLKAFGRGAVQEGMEMGAGTTQLLSRAVPAGLAAVTQAIPHLAMSGARGRYIEAGNRAAGDIRQAGQRMQADTEQQLEDIQQSGAASPSMQRHPGFATAGRLGGGALMTAPFAAAPSAGAGLPLRAAAGAVGAGVGGAMQPVQPGADYWDTKLEQVRTAAAVGGALPVIGAGMSTPMTAAGRTLTGAGVRLSPGQMLGVGGAERVLGSFPILGSVVRGAEGRTLRDWQRAAVNQALEPLGGVTVKRGLQGTALVNAGDDLISDAYNRVLPHITVSQQVVGGPIHSALQTVEKGLPQSRKDQLYAILDDKFFSRFDSAGRMDGQTYKKAEAGLSSLIRSYSKSTDADQALLGKALSDMRTTIRSEVAASDPVWGPQLQKVNYANALFSRIEEASSRRATSEGSFTPADLLATSRASNVAQFRKGDALMQAFANAGNRVIGKGPMDVAGTSRVAEGLAIELGLVGGAAVAGHPGAAIAGAIGPPAAYGAAMAAPAVGRQLPRAAPAAGTAAADFFTRPSPEQLRRDDEQRARDRLKAAGKVGELSSQRYQANRRGDLTEMASLGEKLAAAHREYRELGGTA